MANPVMWFEIAGKNGKELCDFYQTLFEWDVNEEKNGVHECDPSPEEGIKGIIFPTTDEIPFPTHVTVYISVDDLNEKVKKIESHGGKIIIPPQEIPDGMGSFAWFLDPSGNLLGLHKQ